MSRCEFVIEVEPGKDYRYCRDHVAVTVGGNGFCPDHALGVERHERIQGLIYEINEKREKIREHQP
jgi:hypothetical protein